MKKITAVMLTAAMLCGYSTVIAKDEIKVYYDGAQIEFDTVPEIVNERTFVPLRAIAETLGADVAWDGLKDMVTLSKDDVKTYLIIGSDETKTQKGEETASGTLEAAPYIKDERTMVPVRFISEVFGMEVDWDGETLSVLITQPEQEAEPAIEPTAAPLTNQERYAKAYEGTRYKFVQNVPEMTNDFEQSAANIKTEKHSDIGKDINGNGVLYIQKDRRNGETEGSAKSVLRYLDQYGDKLIYDISFDMYCPPANGSVMVALLGTAEINIGSIGVTGRGRQCIIGDEKKPMFESAEYFNNNTAGDDEDVIPANGAHVNIIVNMLKRTYTVMVSGNGKATEPKTITKDLSNYILPKAGVYGFGSNAFKEQEKTGFYGVKFSTLQEGMSIPVIVDDLVTNIVEDTTQQ